jgi:hypothetical protein
MPAPEERPQPLARAQARLAFDGLVRDRVSALRRPTSTGSDGAPVDLPEEVEDRPRLLESLASAFADAVDRGNDGRQYLRQPPIEYVDAVVLAGDAGTLLVDGIEYEGAPVYWQTKAGNPDLAIRGRDLDAYLRTGESRYAAQLGLPT